MNDSSSPVQTVKAHACYFICADCGGSFAFLEPGIADGSELCEKCAQARRARRAADVLEPPVISRPRFPIKPKTILAALLLIIGAGLLGGVAACVRYVYNHYKLDYELAGQIAAVLVGLVILAFLGALVVLWILFPLFVYQLLTRIERNTRPKG